MRHGFTTGSCAAAAAKAAAYMLLTGREKNKITIETPGGIPYHAELLEISRQELKVKCAVRKDGGDDPDVTTGALVFAEVSFMDENFQMDGADISQKIVIDGGIGVGRITKPGLDQPVGNAAINHVPREMIEREVLDVCQFLDYQGSLKVEISVPEGEQLAASTYNPRLGIVGGISILGTTGIVEPMSSQAILDTIKVELRSRRAQGYDYAAISPGNYGQEFMQRVYGYDLDRSIKCSNYIGETMDMLVELGFQRVLLTGHIGKLIKVAGGIMNTHSREADSRMELLAAFALLEYVDQDRIRELLSCVTTEEAVRILKEEGKLEQVMRRVLHQICFYLDKRVQGRISIDCILYANEFGELAKSEGVEKWFTLLEQEQVQRI